MAKDFKSVQIKIPHNVIMEDREKLRISGVIDIGNFSENRVVLSTVRGELVIRGEDLRVVSLEPDRQDSENKMLRDTGGDLTLTGMINSLTYSRHSVLDGPIKKLFH